jgi:hypothetical protein
VGLVFFYVVSDVCLLVECRPAIAANVQGICDGRAFCVHHAGTEADLFVLPKITTNA